MAKVDTKSKLSADQPHESDSDGETVGPAHDEGIKARVDQYVKQLSSRSSGKGSAVTSLQPSTSKGGGQWNACVCDACEPHLEIRTNLFALVPRAGERPSYHSNWAVS